MLIRQNATLKIKSIEIFAIMSCVFVTGIVLRFLEVSQSLSIKNKIAAMIPIRHGSKKTKPYPNIIVCKVHETMQEDDVPDNLRKARERAKGLFA